MDDQNSSAPAAPFFRSFLVVAGGYALSLVGLLGIGLVILAKVFPDSFAICTSPDIKVLKSTIENNPQKILPVKFMFIMLAINALVCIAVGYLVALLAPFKSFMHGVFVAVIVFFGLLQFTIEMPNEMSQQIGMLYMITAPICILLGAKFCLGRKSDTSTDTDFGSRDA